MAALASLNSQQRRRKPVTYGKSRGHEYTFKHDTALAKPSSINRSTTSEEIPRRNIPKEQSEKLSRTFAIPSVKANNVFDVPSSDSDDNHKVVTRRKPQIASKPLSSRHPSVHVTSSESEDGPSRQLRLESSRGLTQQENESSLRRRYPDKDNYQGLSDASRESYVPTALKRKRPTPTPQAHKREELGNKKRSGNMLGSKSGKEVTIAMRMREQTVKTTAVDDVSVWDVPMKDEPTIKKPRRAAPKKSVIRPSVSSGRSAPGALQTMITGTTSKRSGTPPISRRQSCLPQRSTTPVDETLPSTPPPALVDPPTTHSSATPRQTPGQRRVWSQLPIWDDTIISATPSSLKLAELRISGSRPNHKHTVTDLSKTRRPRLIDTLITSAPQDVEDEVEEEKQQEPPVESAMDEDGHCSMQGIAEAELLPSSQSSSKSRNIESTSGAVASTVKHTAKVTYAKERSYLQEDSLEAELMLDLPMASSNFFQNNKHGNSQSKKADLFQPPGLEDNIEELGETKGMRSIHELRAAGINNRFLSDMEELMNDIKDSSRAGTSRRRSAMMELCTKLFDKSFVAKFLDYGFEQILYPHLKNASDGIIGFLMAASIALIIESGAPVNALKHVAESGCMLALKSLLDQSTDISRVARDRRSNMSKVTQASLNDLRTLLLDSPIFGAAEKQQTITPQTMALMSIALLTRKLQDAGYPCDMLDGEMVGKLIAVAEKACKRQIATTPMGASMGDLELVFNILEANSLSSLSGGAMWSVTNLQQLSALYPLILGLKMERVEQEGLNSFALRLCLNLTESKPTVCELFSTPEIIEPWAQVVDHSCRSLASDMDEMERETILQQVVVLLGTMINLSEHSDRARLSILANGDQLLFRLLDSFVVGQQRVSQADSVEESRSNVAFGYLAVLLGNLCINLLIRAKVQSALPGKSLGFLIESIEEFVSVHRSADDYFKVESQKEVHEALTRRLQAVADRLK